MKIRKKENGPIEYVKMEKCPDCGDVVIREAEKEYSGAEFLANDFKFIEIERDEMGLLNEFMEDAGHKLRVGWDYIEFTEDKEIREMMEADGITDDEEED